jgi:aspartyl-tRNA(Asn)/glutamyl-tRNA(Gln) amidotransferase subunit B
VSGYDAVVLTSERALADYFEAAAVGVPKPKAVANWIINDLLGRLAAAEKSLAENPVEAGSLRELALLVESGRINGSQAREVLGEMVVTGALPGEIVKQRGLEQVSDTGFLDEIIGQVIAGNPDAVAKIRGGNDKAVNALKGQVMKLSGGRANPQVVGELLAAAIGRLEE